VRRYPLVLGGTVAGVAAVLAFPTHKATLHLATTAGGSSAAPSGSKATGAGTGTSSGPSTTAPKVGPPAATGSTTPGSTQAPATTVASARSATSADEQFPYGDLTLKVTVKGTKVTDVSVASFNVPDGQSQMIDQYAVPRLQQQVIAAGSANINGISGATFTSQAFAAAVQNALQKLGIKS
jgi:uncharacterized protein with FMN-binding domain